MATLNNKKHEKFAQMLIKYSDDEGKWREVMTEAGFSINRNYFTTLKRNVKVAGRVLELQREAANKEVMSLRERLKMLTVFAQDDKNSQELRIRALRELHCQSGDDVNRVEMDIDSNNINRFVNLELPEREEKSEEVDDMIKMDKKEKRALAKQVKDALDLGVNSTVDDILNDEDLEDLEGQLEGQGGSGNLDELEEL